MKIISDNWKPKEYVPSGFAARLAAHARSMDWIFYEYAIPLLIFSNICCLEIYFDVTEVRRDISKQ